LRVKVTAVGDDTALAGIQRLVTEAQNSSSRAQRLADKAAAWLFWFALGAAIVTAVVWGYPGFGDQPSEAVIRTITVLVIACPHALGLAIPLVVSIATERAARGGVLVKDRLALESMRTVGAVLFDKTGTLTKGEPTVTAVAATDGHTEHEVLALAASAESDSEHPLAKAIVEAARRRELTVPASSDFTSSPAVGVTARVDGRTVRVGGPRLLDGAGQAELPAAGPWRDEGAIVLHVLDDGVVAGALALADEVREESRQAVDALHKLGVQVVMITGDAQTVAESVAAQLGIDRVFAGVRPEDKAAKVAQLQDDRVRGCDPGQLGPALRAVGDPAVEGVVSQDEAKPLVGSGIQPDLGPAGGRCAGADRVCHADVGWCDLDVDLHRGGRAERAATAAAGFAPRSQRAGHSLRI
jgi:Cu2+-exporting ATPase